MTLKGKTNLLFCHIVSLSYSFYLCYIRLVMCYQLIMGICESVVMCHNSELVPIARFAEKVYFPLTIIADMLPGFKEGQEKMSKSDPTSAIFMEDDEVFPRFFCLKNYFSLPLNLKLVISIPNIAI